jgi:hypothetical protein
MINFNVVYETPIQIEVKVKDCQVTVMGHDNRGLISVFETREEAQAFAESTRKGLTEDRGMQLHFFYTGLKTVPGALAMIDAGLNQLLMKGVKLLQESGIGDEDITSYIAQAMHESGFASFLDLNED